MAYVHQRTRVCMLILVGVFVLGVVGFMLAEGLGPVDAAYFAVVTMSTVGYGDISPGTAAGKLVSVLFILSGVGAFMALIASATEDLLNSRDRRIRRDKCHMLTGLFFSEIGTDLLRLINAAAAPDEGWTERLVPPDAEHVPDFGELAERLAGQGPPLDARQADLAALRDFLNRETNLLLRLLENPALLENESFTELLRAVFHLREELAHRPGFVELPDSDLAHLSGDLGRVRDLIVPEWLRHMDYLQDQYPYLFSLALRTNPFDAHATAVVR